MIRRPQEGTLGLRALMVMTFPLMLEGLLCISVGFFDTLMVSSLSESAVSAVSTVDSLGVLINELLVAIATGGTVVISQHLGSKQKIKAADTGRQLMYVNIFLGVILGICGLLLSNFIIGFLFSGLESSVFSQAGKYFKIVSISFPFVAMFHCGSAIFRARGEFKASMLLSLFMNVINISANALFIYGFKWGVAGAAAGTVVARASSAFFMLWLLNKNNPHNLHHILHIASNKKEIFRILQVGIPCGIENTLFHIGKIMLQSIIVSLGTAALAANAIVNNLSGLSTIPANAFCIVTLTLVGNSVGAQNYNLAQSNIKKLTSFCYISLMIFNALLFISANFWTGLFGLSYEITQTSAQLVRLYAVGSMLFWTPSFLFPSALRAAGDAKFTMKVSFISMWTFRIGLSCLLVFVFKMGIWGIWICMLIDWFVRAIIFTIRLISGKWKNKRLVS